MYHVKIKIANHNEVIFTFLFTFHTLGISRAVSISVKVLFTGRGGEQFLKEPFSNFRLGKCV